MSATATRYAAAGKYLASARICSGCAAIVGRGEEISPDNHWPWCEGGDAVALTRESYAAASAASDASAVSWAHTASWSVRQDPHHHGDERQAAAESTVEQHEVDPI